MSASLQEVQQTRAYLSASKELTGWIAGAKALALLSGAADSGVLEALRTKSTAEQIADVTSTDRKSIVDLCLALEVHGVAQRDGECYELTPDFALLSSPGAAIPLSSVIGQARVMIRALQTSAPSDTTYTTTLPEDVLAMAKGSGVSALSPSVRVAQETIADALPEVEALWQAGARHLEVGCGVGNNLLGTVATHPNVIAVGSEFEVGLNIPSKGGCNGTQSTHSAPHFGRSSDRIAPG